MPTASPPLKVTLCPVASIVVSFVSLIVFVSVMVPSHANVTRPPPASAARRLASSQTVTVPAAKTEVEPHSRTSDHKERNEVFKRREEIIFMMQTLPIGGYSIINNHQIQAGSILRGHLRRKSLFTMLVKSTADL